MYSKNWLKIKNQVKIMLNKINQKRGIGKSANIRFLITDEIAF